MERRLLRLLMVTICAVTFFALVGTAHASFTANPYSSTRLSIFSSNAAVFPFTTPGANHYWYRIRLWYWPINTTGAPTGPNDSTNINQVANGYTPKTLSHVIWPYACVEGALQASQGWGDSHPYEDLSGVEVDRPTPTPSPHAFYPEDAALLYTVSTNPEDYISAERFPDPMHLGDGAGNYYTGGTIATGSWYYFSVFPFVGDCVYYAYIQYNTNAANSPPTAASTWLDLTASMVPAGQTYPGRYVGTIYSGSGYQFINYTRSAASSNFNNDAYMQMNEWYPGYLDTGGGTKWGSSVWSSVENFAGPLVGATAGITPTQPGSADTSADLIFDSSSGWTPIPLVADTSAPDVATVNSVGDQLTPDWVIHEPQIWDVAWRGAPTPTYTPAVPGGAPATYANIWPLWSQAPVSPYDYPVPAQTSAIYSMGPAVDGGANAWFGQFHDYFVYAAQEAGHAAQQPPAYYLGSIDGNASDAFSGNNLTGFGGLSGNADASAKVHINLNVAGTAAQRTVKLYSSKNSYGGNAYIYIDKTFSHDPTQTPASAPAPSYTANLYSASTTDNVPVYTFTPAAGAHTVDIMGWDLSATTQSRTPAGSSGTFVYHDAYTVGADTITMTDWDQTSPNPVATATSVAFPNIRYENNTDGQTQYGWPLMQGAQYKRVGTTYTADVAFCSSTRGACALAFQGTSITYFYVKEPNGGKADVYVDGVYQGQIDEYAASETTTGTGVYTTYTEAANHWVNTETNLGGWHMLLIRNDGTKNTSSSGYRIFVDGFAVPSGTALTLDN